MKNPGILLQHEDGRKGIAYHKDQGGKVESYLVRLIDENYKLSSASGVIWEKDKVKMIGFVD